MGYPRALMSRQFRYSVNSGTPSNIRSLRKKDFCTSFRDIFSITSRRMSPRVMLCGLNMASVIIVSILGLVVFSIFKQVTNKDNNVFESFEKSTNEDSNKKVTVKYQEKAKTNDIIVTLDSYELFEYKSDNFPEHYNTKDGYQKIAFHFIIENLSNETFNTTFDGKVSLTADDYKVSSTSMEKCVFCYTAVGKDNYESIQNTEIASSEKLQGYVGFEVPKDKKNLKFKFGDYIFITMDNPVYQG